MLFKDALVNVAGLRAIVEDCMTIQSPAGRRILYDTPFMTDGKELEKEYNKILTVINKLCTYENMQGGEMPNLGLWQLKDIEGTLKRLQEKCVLDDIELFEIKNLALLAGEVVKQLQVYKLKVVRIPDLSAVMELLDPEHSGVGYFYVYNAYSEDLAEVRADIRKEKDEAVLDGLRNWEKKLEEEVRVRLAEQLRVYGKDLEKALENMGRLDVLVGKAEFAILWGLCFPKIVDRRTVYKELWNINVKSEVEGRRQTYQAVDVSVEPCATVITGANMSGKSVLLKSLLLAQYMAQFGFFVPAADVEIVPVDEIFICMGDDQDDRHGLSSYAAEMLKIDKVIKAVKAGKKVLALIDEPARTTNPVEGVAIVNALVHFLTKHRVRAMVTTHYSGLDAKCRRLRIKGFVEEKIKGDLSVDNINQCIDYSLEEEEQEEVPQEALRIAEILGVDRDLIKGARKYLDKQN